MRNLFLVVISLLAVCSLQARIFVCPFQNEEERDGYSFTIVELNCENLFDCLDDSLKQDEAFLPNGMYQWTYGKYWKKVNNIAREILACGEDSSGNISIPDIVALCEVENDTVIRDLTERSLLRNAKYESIVTHSPDERGIDVALLYSPFSFGFIESNAIRVVPLKNMRPTRDILYVKGRIATGDTLNVFVVHAPSRSGGEYETRQNRLCVAKKLCESMDSLRQITPDSKIIIAGDFNDYSKDPSIRLIEQHKLIDISGDAIGINNQAKGTYKYHGEWDSLDHIFVSESLDCNVVSCKIGDFPFLLCKDDDYGGVQPNRNFRGVKWQNGFSDHLPLILRISF